MSDGVYGGVGTFPGGNFAALLTRYIGETVTIFTSSGGESGSGFTGVILSVTESFVRLLTRIGPPPGCSLGNACSNFNVGNGYGYGPGKVAGANAPYGANMGYNPYGGGYGPGMVPGPILPASEVGAVSAGGWDAVPVYTVGSVTDIPIAAIVSFVHNAV
ncbi:MAG: hypothetical protein N2484_01365 [Clostridia bacterium]|nr:hypothetical protein [Clostridia bacterium]